LSSFSEIDVAEVETRADEMLGPVSGNEYDLLLSKLAGARGNRVFSFFGIEAPQRAAETLLAVQKAGGKVGGTGGVTATLEKKKRKKGGSGPGGGKRSKLLDFLTSSPLRSAGESEDNGGDGNPVTASSPPSAARPIAAVAPPPKPSLALEYSAREPGSDDELVQEIQSILETTEPHAKNSAEPLRLRVHHRRFRIRRRHQAARTWTGPVLVPTDMPLPPRWPRPSLSARAAGFLPPGLPAEGPRRSPRQRAAATT